MPTVPTHSRGGPSSDGMLVDAHPVFSWSRPFALRSGEWPSLRGSCSACCAHVLDVGAFCSPSRDAEDVKGPEMPVTKPCKMRSNALGWMMDGPRASAPLAGARSGAGPVVMQLQLHSPSGSDFARRLTFEDQDERSEFSHLNAAWKKSVC